MGLRPMTSVFGPVTIGSMDDLHRLKGRYPENFVLTSLLEECQDWRVKKGGTWRTLRVPDRTHGGQGHS